MLFYLWHACIWLIFSYRLSQKVNWDSNNSWKLHEFIAHTDKKKKKKKKKTNDDDDDDDDDLTKIAFTMNDTKITITIIIEWNEW